MASGREIERVCPHPFQGTDERNGLEEAKHTLVILPSVCIEKGKSVLPMEAPLVFLSFLFFLVFLEKFLI